jgi:enolase-phosphatase E1
MCDDAMIVETLQGWIEQDRKHTALKALQGMVWEAGYRDGDFTAPLYPDVAPALRAWHAPVIRCTCIPPVRCRRRTAVLRHTDAGDLTPLFSGYFDTDQSAASAIPTATA